MSNLGTRIDILYTKKLARLKLQKEVDKMKEDEDAELVAIGLALAAQGTKVQGGMMGLVERSIVRKVVVDDWAAFQTHILETGNLALLESRVMRSTVQEHWQAGEVVPGITWDDQWVAKLKKA